MARRFGERASIEYHDVSRPDERAANEDVVAAIHEQGLIYPVAVLGDDLVCEGAVSYPAILRAVDAALAADAR